MVAPGQQAGPPHSLDAATIHASLVKADAILSRLALPSAGGAEWRGIESAPKGAPNEEPISVLISWTNLNERDEIAGRYVGEAYWHPEDPTGGGWWWANTGPGDYYANPVSLSITGQITHWLPLPSPPKGEGA